MDWQMQIVQFGQMMSHIYEGNVEGPNDARHTDRWCWPRLANDSHHCTWLWTISFLVVCRLRTIEKLKCYVNSNWHWCARVMDLITKFDTGKQLCAVINLLNGKDHCSGKAQLSEVNAAERTLSKKVVVRFVCFFSVYSIYTTAKQSHIHAQVNEWIREYTIKTYCLVNLD